MNDKVEYSENKKTLTKFWLSIIGNYKLAFSAIIISMFFWSIFDSFYPFIIKKVINIVSDKSLGQIVILNKLYYIGLLYVMMLILLELSMRANEYLEAYFFPRVKCDIRIKMFETIYGYKYPFFQNSMIGSLSGKITDMTRSFENIIKSIIHGFYPILCSFLISLILLGMTSLYFSLFIGAWFCTIFLISIFFSKSILLKAYNYAYAENSVSGKIVDIFKNILAAKLFSNKLSQRRYLETYQLKSLKLNNALNLHILKLHLIQGLLTVSMMISVFFILVFKWKYSQITPGDFVFILMTTFNLSRTIFWTSEQVTNVHREWGVAKQALELMNNKKVEDEVKSDIYIKDYKIVGDIRFENITFYYHENVPIFKNFNLLIKKNQRVGIVGLSGSGKTSLIYLLMRFFEPISGKISIGGVDIKEIPYELLRKNISAVFHESHLFNRSIVENISFGDPSASIDDIINVTKIAHAHEFIIRNENGYNTIIGEMGAKLSAGQKQRIAIARALIKKSSIIILDEFTSALDAVTEKALEHSLKENMKDATCVIIAHRLTIMEKVDRVIIMNHGDIVGDGHHNELIVNNIYYQQLWRAFKNIEYKQKTNEVADIA